MTINNWDKQTVEFLDEKCFKNRITKVEKKLVESLKLIPDLKIIDYGCGTGRLVEILKTLYPDFNIKNNYIGVDQSQEMILKAKEKYPDLEFSLLDPFFQPIKDFNTLISLDVLQHQNKPMEFLDIIFALETDNVFIETWSKENGQNLEHTENIITLQSGNQFYENIYSLKAIEELGAIYGMNIDFENECNAYDTTLFYYTGISEVLAFYTGYSVQEIDDFTNESMKAEKVIVGTDIKETLQFLKNTDIK